MLGHQSDGFRKYSTHPTSSKWDNAMTRRALWSIPGKLRLVWLFVLASFLMLVLSPDARSQSSDQSVTSHYLKYFLDAPPAAFDSAKLPPDARDIVIAKVRNLERSATYLLGRHGESPSRDRFFMRVQIVDVLSGRAQVGAKYDVYFGVRGLGGPQLIYPSTPRQNTLEYFVVSYLSADDKRRLLPFPATEQEYSGWEQETHEHMRLRSRPGHRD
jgi:hypothetical protein